jgi:large subunit ribosomal protein L4
MAGVEKNLVLSSRNIQRTKVVLAQNLNTYDILNANKVFFVESSVNSIHELLA